MARCLSLQSRPEVTPRWVSQIVPAAAPPGQLSLRGVVAGLIQPLRPNSRLIELGARCTLLKTQLDHRTFFTTQVFVVLTRCEAVLNGTR